MVTQFVALGRLEMVLRVIEEGEPVTQVARRMGMSRQCVSKWDAPLPEERGTSGLDPSVVPGGASPVVVTGVPEGGQSAVSSAISGSRGRRETEAAGVPAGKPASPAPWRRRCPAPRRCR